MANIDDLIEQLSFGQSAPKVSNCLGLYMSPETIYISETHFDKAGKLVVDHLVRIPVPAPDAGDGKTVGPGTGTLNTDFLTDNSKLAALIRQSMSQIKWNSKNVMVTLSHHLGLLRYFTMPSIDRPFWKTAIPMEAKKYIPIPFDALTYDYQVLPLPPDAANKPRQGALIAVTQRKNLANISALLQNLGLTICGMEVAPCSVLRMWQSLEKAQVDPYAQVHFDAGNVRILVADKGIPVFFREVFLGPDASVADQRKVDLGNCLGFTQKQLSVAKIPQVRVSGSGQTLSQWVDVFGTETGIPAAVQDTPAMLGIKGGDWGGYASIGASLRFTGSKTMTLDLGAVGRVTDEERRVAKDILIIGCVLAALLCVVGLFRTLTYQIKARELSKYKRDAQLEAVFAGRGPADIEAMLKSMQDQIDATGTILDSETKISKVLKEVVESLPEKVWLTSIMLTNPVQRSERVNPELTLAGHAVAPTPQEEQDLSYQLRERLSKAPLASKLFTDLQVSVQHKADNSGASDLSVPGSQPLDPDAFADKQEQRTEWRILAKKK